MVSEVPTRIFLLFDTILRVPADCSKLYIITDIKLNSSSIIVRSSQHIVVFKGRAKWFNNPPIVNINMNPKENNIGVVNLIEPP